MERGLEELEGEERERAEAEIRAMEGRSAIYHCVSRMVNRDFVLKREEKEEFVRLMRLYERFCEVAIFHRWSVPWFRSGAPGSVLVHRSVAVCVGVFLQMTPETSGK